MQYTWSNSSANNLQKPNNQHPFYEVSIMTANSQNILKHLDK